MLMGGQALIEGAEEEVEEVKEDIWAKPPPLPPSMEEPLPIEAPPVEQTPEAAAAAAAAAGEEQAGGEGQ